jgi:hypothetical protein
MYGQQPPYSYPPQVPPYSQYPQYPQQAYPHDPMQVARVPAHLYEKGKTLVFWSRMIVLGSLLACLASCGVAIAGVPQALGGLLLGVPGFIVAAVVGTIGRRMQGRIV